MDFTSLRGRGPRLRAERGLPCKAEKLLRGMVADWKETVNWAIARHNTINSLPRQFHFFVTINPKEGRIKSRLFSY